MKTVEELRDPALSRGLLNHVERAAAAAAAAIGRIPVIMELCGTHTASFSKAGLRPHLEGKVKLLSGPGCPVCVTSDEELTAVLTLARENRAVVAAFGDMLRVPAGGSSLEKERARGASVILVSSPLEALVYAEAHPQQQLLFLGVGFETTAPVTALALSRAATSGTANFSIYNTHKLVPPVLHQLLNDPKVRLDGIILPGHVCAVTGRAPFAFLARDYSLPAVVAGFDTPDILSALLELLNMVAADEPRVVNSYRRLVREEGNPRALSLLETFFEAKDTSWRGFGAVENSGLALKPRYRSFDGAARFGCAPQQPAMRPEGLCSCGELLRGKIIPPQCPLYGRQCRPEQPVGPCMVSAEGACSSYYRFERRRVV